MKPLTYEQQKAFLVALGKALAEGDYTLIEDSLGIGHGSDNLYEKPIVEDFKITFSVVGNNGLFGQEVLKLYNDGQGLQ